LATAPNSTANLGEALSMVKAASLAHIHLPCRRLPPGHGWMSPTPDAGQRQSATNAATIIRSNCEEFRSLYNRQALQPTQTGSDLDTPDRRFEDSTPPDSMH